MIGAGQYAKLNALLREPNAQLSDEVRAQVLQEVQAYEDQYLGKAAAGEAPLAEGQSARVITQASPAPTVTPAAPPEMPMSSGVDPRTNTNDDLEAHRLLMRLDPNQPLLPQVLATQPATTHPLGDEAAKDEWLRGPLDNPKGVTVVYDAPVDVVRQKLAADPQLWRAMGMRVPLTPDKAMHIKQGDSVHRAYNDLYFRMAAADLASQGKTAYRYNQAPYLSSGPNAGLLQTLQTKLDAMPADGPTALVLGMDQGGAFGLGRSELEAANPNVHGEMSGSQGGIPQQTDLTSYDAMAQEEHPALYRTGAVLGSLAPWSLANRLFGWVYGGVSGALAGEAPGALRGMVASGAGAGAGAAATQLANDAVRAHSDMQQTGQTDATALGTAGHAMLTGLEGAVPGGFLGFMQGVGNTVRTGPRYQQLPARVEAMGGEAKLGRGFVDPPVIAQARRDALARGESPVGTIAAQLDEPLRGAARDLEQQTAAAGERNAAAYYPTREGKDALPATNLVQSAIERMRALTGKVEDLDQVRAVGRRNAANAVRDVLSQNVGGVSAQQGLHGIPIRLDEARAFLGPEWQGKLDLLVQQNERRNNVASNARGRQFLNASDRAALGLEEGAKKLDTVYLVPRRYDAQSLDETIGKLAKSSDEDVKGLHQAALADREQRVWNGLKGGWAQVQAKQEQGVAAAKDLTRVAPDRPRGAYDSVVAASKTNAYRTPDVQALEDLAMRADADPTTGKPLQGRNFDLLRGAHLTGPYETLHDWGSFGRNGPTGHRWALGLPALSDAMVLRGLYPASNILGQNPNLVLQGTRVAPAVTGAVIDEMAREDERRRREKEKQK